MKASISYHSPEDTQALFKACACTEALPAAGQKVLIALPGRAPEHIDLIEVERAPKGAAGVFKVSLSSKASRGEA